MSIEKIDFKGKPIIQIKEDYMKVPFCFGVKKAMLILQYINEIEKFVKEENKEK